MSCVSGQWRDRLAILGRNARAFGSRAALAALIGVIAVGFATTAHANGIVDQTNAGLVRTPGNVLIIGSNDDAHILPAQYERVLESWYSPAVFQQWQQHHVSEAALVAFADLMRDGEFRAISSASVENYIDLHGGRFPAVYYGDDISSVARRDYAIKADPGTLVVSHLIQLIYQSNSLESQNAASYDANNDQPPRPAGNYRRPTGYLITGVICILLGLILAGFAGGYSRDDKYERRQYIIE